MQALINDFSMVYTDEGNGTPLAWIHGFPLSRRSWVRQVDAFKGDHRVIAPDLRGLGESALGQGPSTMDAMAGDVAALLEQVNAGPVVLGGHSMGGYVAFAFARRYPALVRGLVLVATRPGADTPEGAAARRATAEKVRQNGPEGLFDDMATKLVRPQTTDTRLIAAVRAMMNPAVVPGVIAAVLGMAERPDSTPLLAHLAMPVLVVTGQDDSLIPSAESEKMSAMIPGSDLKIIPAAGHMVMYEQPAEFNRVLAGWLETHHL